jgi:hypothetical protein
MLVLFLPLIFEFFPDPLDLILGAVPRLSPRGCGTVCAGAAQDSSLATFLLEGHDENRARHRQQGTDDHAHGKHLEVPKKYRR